jgi:hypothetical protein
VFQLKAPTGTGAWTESVIYNFLGGKDGSGPQSPLTVHKGSLYGSTCCGPVGGTVFSLTKGTSGTWTKAPLFNFATYSVGEGPSGSLAVDSNGVVYGATAAGGPSGAGVVFALAPGATGKPYKLTNIHSFANGTDGGAPYGGVVLSTSGTLYVPLTSGCKYSVGGVAQFVPPTGTGAWTETVLYDFTGASDGSQAQGLVLVSNTTLYGTTGFEGAAGYGTVFELIP